jgi:hypothetical protein
MRVVLSSCERGTNANALHAAPGRQVSTWAHAVKADELSLVGGSSSILASTILLK